MSSPMEVSLQNGSEVGGLSKPEGVSGRPAPAPPQISAADEKVPVSAIIKIDIPFLQLSEEGPGEEPSGDDLLSSFDEWVLPAREFDGLWERILRISKVAKLFQKIQEMVEEENNLVFVLIGSLSSDLILLIFFLECVSNDHLVIVVNALLTQMDKLKSWPNVIILTTSNITTAIGKLFMPLKYMMLLSKDLELDVVADIAFVDRADIKAYVGPPTLEARYEILRSCLQELLRAGIVTYPQVLLSKLLLS
ncbi:hypothetical protein B296_00022254 [Ensete ventricosum]|uniref:Pachytene checkpoint protein 2 homolog n=1 Tax=Ensete ventricosum TaxID=4639 RepID=A0A426ZBH7_ENSVE|nr:hypothetical protein B296_00022254 [Ensete ventricosum]